MLPRPRSRYRARQCGTAVRPGLRACGYECARGRRRERSVETRHRSRTRDYRANEFRRHVEEMVARKTDRSTRALRQEFEKTNEWTDTCDPGDLSCVGPSYRDPPK